MFRAKIDGPYQERVKALVLDTHDALSAILEKRRDRKRLPEPRTRRRVRERAGLTQADLAQVLGVDRATISRWESGERAPRPSQLGPYVVALERLMREAIG